MIDLKMRSYTVCTPEYDGSFWNMMKGNRSAMPLSRDIRDLRTNGYILPTGFHTKVVDAIKKHSIFRSIATTEIIRDSDHTFFAAKADDVCVWVPESEDFPLYDGMDDFTQLSVRTHKVGCCVKLDDEFLFDELFNVESHLAARFGKGFAGAEDKAFIQGTGVSEPTGILHATKGAKTGISAEELTADDVIGLFFSVDTEYREGAVWLMNNKTALAVRKLKDSSGRYLWAEDGTLFGKKVIISDYMPDIEAGAKPIAFGDFSRYLIVIRNALSARSLKELFAMQHRIGFLCFEFLDGFLADRDAIKVLCISSAE